MKEIREIFETVRTYCGMMFGDAKRPRGKEDKSVSEAARQLGSQAAKLVMKNTESILAPMAGEDAIVHERLVSVTSAGAGESQNEIIQSYPSPEFLNSLPFIKKFYPAPRWGEGKVTDVAFDNNPNSSETDHASMPLGIFASKSVSHKANVGGVGTPPYVAKSVSCWHSNANLHLAAWLPSCLAAKRAAFTLAEVLITLGIIGVVAALTLPTLIQNHQKQFYVTQLKKAYSNISNAYNQIANDEGVTEWSQTCLTDWTEPNNCLHKLAKQMKAINTKDFDVTCSADWCKYGWDLDDGIYISSITSIFNQVTGMFTTPDGVLYMFPCGGFYSVVVDVNGINKSPNKPGRDIFEFGRKITSDYDTNGHWIGYTYYNSLEPIGANSGEWKNCSATNLSSSCTAKVLIEGKMNY